MTKIIALIAIIISDYSAGLLFLSINSKPNITEFAIFIFTLCTINIFIGVSEVVVYDKSRRIV